MSWSKPLQKKLQKAIQRWMELVAIQTQAISECEEKHTEHRWTETYALLSIHSVLSDSLLSHGLQQARLPCPSLSPGVCSNSCLLSWWCHPIISSSAALFSFCLKSFPASEYFPMSQTFTSGGQGIGASATVLPVNIQGWFPLALTSLNKWY